jgi:hypothetical protein
MSTWKKEYYSEFNPPVGIYLDNPYRLDGEFTGTGIVESLPKEISYVDRYWICWMLGWIGRRLNYHD